MSVRCRLVFFMLISRGLVVPTGLAVVAGQGLFFGCRALYWRRNVKPLPSVEKFIDRRRNDAGIAKSD